MKHSSRDELVRMNLGMSSRYVDGSNSTQHYCDWEDMLSRVDGICAGNLINYLIATNAYP